MTHNRRRTSLLMALVSALISAIVLVAGGSTVSAHAGLVSSTPAANSVLESSPDLVTLTFDEPIAANLASIQLFNQSRQMVPIGDPAGLSDPSIVQADLPVLDPGTYAIVWRVSSVDGHVVDGAFSFQIGTSSGINGDDLVNQVANGASATDAVQNLSGINRWVGLTGLLVLIGTVFIGYSASPRRLRSLLTIASFTVAVSTALAYGLYGAQVVAGSVGTVLNPRVWGDIAGARTARWLLVRLAVSMVLVALARRSEQRHSIWWRTTMWTLLAVSVFTWSAAGHAATSRPLPVWIAIDAAHLGAAGMWIGALIAMAWCGPRWIADPAAASTLRRFSRWATFALPVIVATGVAQTLKLSGGIDRIGESNWGRFLIAKLVVVTVLISIGAVSRWLLHNGEHRSMGRTVVAEAVLGFAVIGLAAGLIAVPPQVASVAQPVTTTLSSGGVIVDLTVSPALVGSNEVHFVVTPPGGNLDPIVSLQARVSLPSGSIPNSPVTIVKEGINHFSGSVTFVESGTWTLEIIIETAPSQTVLLSTQVPVNG